MIINAEGHIKRYNSIKGARSNFESYWQTLHDYFYIEGCDITSIGSEGSELTITNLYDSVSLECADILAAGLCNYLTPPTSKWLAIKHPDEEIMQDKSVRDWFGGTQEEVYSALNRSNFYNEMPSFYKSSGVYGTGVLFEEEDYEDDIRFYAMPVKQAYLIEDHRQRVTEAYILFEYTVYQAVTRFGLENVSQAIRESYESNRDEQKKYEFLLFIGPRHERDPRMKDNKNMAFKAVWVDICAKKVVKEGGYNTMPLVAHRFYKRPGVVWGYSPGMKALIDTRVMNAMAKTELRAAMKMTDSPIAMPDNMFITPMNYNPRGLNFYKKGPGFSRDDVFPLGNFGNPKIGMEAMEYRNMRIRAQMFTDVFLAFSNMTKQMTVPEVMERITEKMTLLGPAVGRFLSDVLDPVITRTIDILASRGSLPPLPDALVYNPNYSIEYVSALAKAQKANEMQALQSALALMANAAQYFPEILDGMNPDEIRDVTWDITGAPMRVLRDDEEIAQIREGRAQQQAQLQEQAMLAQGAQTVKVGAEAGKIMREAQNAGEKG